jgi:hypothetical protein
MAAIRAATADQAAGLDAQARDLKAVGAEKVFSEQVSSIAMPLRSAGARRVRQRSC